LTLNSNLSNITSKINEISKRPDSRKIANESITNLAIKEATIVNENIANNTITKSKLTADVYDNPTFTGVTLVDSIYAMEIILANQTGEVFPSVQDGRIGGIYYPYAMDAGRVTIAAVANTNVSVTVTLDANRFTIEPIITVTPDTGVPANSRVSVHDVLYDIVTGVVTFSLVLNRTTSTSTPVNWIAIQMNMQP
jgi:hypothetical protein